jgi:phenylacetate-CoA oxygenase PaaI subunit
MSPATVREPAAAEKAAQLPEDARAALRALLLALADSKRLLGMRYSDWMIGAPTLEAGIAASSMAQDEWGHARLTYALLGDFGDDVKRLEHERSAAEYHSMEALDAPLTSWGEVIAAGLILDSALALQYGALLESRYAPVHNRVQKLLDEERFHYQHAAGWTRRIGQAPGTRAAFGARVAALLADALRWFGPDDGAAARLVEEGIVRQRSAALRTALIARVGPVLSQAGLAEAVGLARADDGGWMYAGSIDWEGWDERTRRNGASAGPDEATIARVRGDRNRALLLD